MFVIITGASRGIGKALAYKFASKNYDLILTCEKNIKLLDEIKSDIENKYGKKVITKMGLLDDNEIPSDTYILINNAGKCDYNLLSDITYERYKEIIYSNLDYNFLTTKAVSQVMIKNKQGIIANISSMWGILGASLESVYSLTKGGINAFTKSLAKEFNESKVDVIAFALGAVDTEMNSNLKGSEREEFLNSLDEKKMFTVSEIADKIYSIISERKFKNGDIIELNNGLK